MSDWYDKTVESTLQELYTTDSGLASKEAESRLQRDGPNQLRIKTEPLWRKLIKPFANVFIAVLLMAAALSVAMGHALDAVIIGAVIAISAIIYYVQAYSTERVLRALKQTARETVHVLRDGESVELPVEQLVVGDVVMLSEGEKVPADLRLIQAENVRADEAMLTGESLPINKQTHVLEGTHPVYEQTNMLFQGSFIVGGMAKGVVVATANQTEYGKLANLSVPQLERSPTQKKIDDLIRQLIIAIAFLTVLVLGLEIWRGIELFEALRFVMAMAVSAVPEGLPVAITVVMVLGMRRMAKHKALARSMKAVETIGVITTIATDKTGTLTKNKLSVQEIWQPEGQDKQTLAKWARLAINHSEASSDPLDIAMDEFVAQAKLPGLDGRSLKQNFPFDQDLALSGITWQVGPKLETVIKGAPEKILQRSLKKGTAEYKEAEKQLEEFTKHGYRVIALARAEHGDGPLETLADLPKASLQFIGLIAIADELRPEAKKAIRGALDAGITVRMITGDHAETAFSIGKELGLVERREQVLDCREIDKMSEDELRAKVRDIRVFARVVPEAKHRILSILKARDITAMTGDGVNDVPALSNAHLGIAMGSGSQIAKEAGDVVLLDDNFASVVRGVEGGRVIFDNIRRILYHMLGTSLGEVLVFIIALIVGLPLPVVAVQILWVNLVTDTAFDIPLGFEPAESDVMKRPPRGVKQGLLDRHLIERFVLVAIVMAIITVVTFWYYLQSHPLEYAQTIAFMVLVVVQWANAFNARSEFTSLVKRIRVPNIAFYIGFLIAFGLQLLVLFGPLAEPLHVVPVDLADLIIPSAIAFALTIVVGELHKWYGRKVLARREKVA